MKAKTAVAIASLLTAATVQQTSAAVVISALEAGGDVVFSATGSLDLTDAVFLSNNPFGAGVTSGAIWYLGVGDDSGFNTVDQYALSSFDGAFGTGSFQSGVGAGDPFLIFSNSGGTPRLGVPGGYVSGTSLSSTLTVASSSFSGLGLIEGSYEYAIPNDLVTLNIGTAMEPIPVPSSLPLALLGLGALGLIARRR